MTASLKKLAIVAVLLAMTLTLVFASAGLRFSLQIETKAQPVGSQG